MSGPSLLDIGPAPQSNNSDSFADFTVFQGSKNADEFNPRGSVAQGKTILNVFHTLGFYL